MIKFGEWMPDQPWLNNAGATEAKNVIPALSGYRSFKGLAAVSGAATAKITGMWSGKDDSSNSALYAGDAGKLYKLNAADSALTDLSKAGGYSSSADEKWRFAQFGETVIATNFDDPVQKSIVASGTAFADLAGTPPKAKFICTVRDQVMLGHTLDVSDGVKPYRLWWSAINNEASWTPGTGLSDYQDVMDAGSMMGLVGGEHAIALFENAIVRGTFVGAPLIYQFDRLTTVKGCSVQGSVASVGSSLVFFLSDDGFYMLSGNDLKPIGAEKINRWFFKRFKIASKENMCAAIDPINQNVIWAYPSVESTSGENDEILIYNYNLNRWSYAVQDCTALAQAVTAGYTLEQLDNVSSSIDALPASLDDGIWKGGTFFFAGAKDKKIQSFTGTALEAVIETGEFQIAPGRRSLVNAVVPYVNSLQGQLNSITAAVASRTHQNQIGADPYTSSAQVFPQSGSDASWNGSCPLRSFGAYHRVRLTLTGTWEVAMGVDVDMQQAGTR